MNVLQFMTESPFLTFFLVLITGEALVRSLQALRGSTGHCGGCRCDTDSREADDV